MKMGHEDVNGFKRCKGSRMDRFTGAQGKLSPNNFILMHIISVHYL
jgi:hypothetical protein